MIQKSQITDQAFKIAFKLQYATKDKALLNFFDFYILLRCMANMKSIGVFDSGLGGLTVLAALQKKFPSESYVYLGDTARVPYGTKSPETVIQYALNNAQALMQQADLKLLVIACNTATAFALDTLQKTLPIPVIGVIEPGVKACLEHTPKSIAILGTRGTIGSKAYEHTLRSQGYTGEIHALACPLWVPLVEEGLITGPIADQLAQHYLSQLPNSIDAVILGCTHYPLLLPTLQKHMPKDTIWIDSGSSAANYLPPLQKGGQGGFSSTQYFVTDAPERFTELASLFLGKPVSSSEVRLIDVGVSS